MVFFSAANRTIEKTFEHGLFMSNTIMLHLDIDPRHNKRVSIRNNLKKTLFQAIV